MTAAVEQPVATHPDIFSEDEAVAYLRMVSVTALRRNARKCKVRGVRGGKGGHEVFYAREQLDAMRLSLFGLATSGRNK